MNDDLEISRLSDEQREAAFAALMRSAQKMLPFFPAGNPLLRRPRTGPSRGVATLARAKAKGQFILPWRAPLRNRK